jgi:2-octaprenyl-6-methoxyphenol hydroxylase
MARNNVDVLIAGGGFAGLTLAIALRQALGPSFAITVADPALGKSYAGDERASAIVAAVRRLFETLGVWERVEHEAQPMLDMVITDSRLDDAVRPTFLTFAGEVEPGEPFAHIIENVLLVDALTA